MRGRQATALALILVLGALVRLALLCWFQGEPLYVWDERDYDVLATNLLVHQEFAFKPGAPTSLRPPLYPLVVAGIYAVAGAGNYQAVRLVQAGLGLLTALVMYRLGSRVHSRRAGLWLAGFVCFYPSLLAQGNLLLTETLFTLLLCSACYTAIIFYQDGKLRYLALTGLLLGLTALTRSVVWMAPPFLALFVLATWRAAWPRRLLAPVILLATFAAVLAPWSIRNTNLQQTFTLVDTMGGRNFMMGNYQHTPLYRSWDTIAIEGEQSWFAEIVAAYPADVRDTQGKVDKLALRQGLQFVRAHPWLTLQRDIIKFFDFWGLEREFVAGASRGYWGELPTAAILILAVAFFGSYALAMVAGIFGAMVSGLHDRRIFWLLLCVVAYVCGMHTLVFGHSRYHLPLMPIVLLFTTVALLERRAIWEARLTWRFRWATLVSCVLIGGWAWGLFAGDAARFLAIFQAAIVIH